MNRASSLSAVLLVASILAGPTPATAGRFDVIFCDAFRLDSGIGGGVAPPSFGMIVNTSSTEIVAEELFNATFQVTASVPEFTATPLLNDPGPWYPVAPILPGEAVGVLTSRTETLLSPLVSPNEKLRDLPAQFFSIDIQRLETGYQGLVTFDVVMFMAGERAEFTLTGNFTIDDPSNDDFEYLSAARVSSVAVPTARHAGSWGAIKRMFR